MLVTPYRAKTFLLFLLVGCASLLLFYFEALPTPSNFSFKSTASSHSDSSEHISDININSTTTSAGTPKDHTNHTQSGPKILLVSAYFPFKNSKTSHSAFKAWLRNMLGPISTDVYLFTTPEMEPYIRSLRGEQPITINTTYTSPFDIHPLKWTRNRYNKMQRMDPEHGSPETYALQNAKPWFLDQAVKNAKGYEFAFWIDAESFKDAHHVYKAWPDASRVTDMWNSSRSVVQESKSKLGEMMFFQTWDLPDASMTFWTEAMGPVRSQFSEGSFFGGPPLAISWYRGAFYKYHNSYLKSSMFVGKDEFLTNALMLLFPSRFLAVWVNDPLVPNSILQSSTRKSLRGGESLLGVCDDLWHYYQFLFASQVEQQGMKVRFLEEIKWPWSRKAWSLNPAGWFDEREPCRVVVEDSVQSLLSKHFGGGWRAPPHTLK